MEKSDENLENEEVEINVKTNSHIEDDSEVQKADVKSTGARQRTKNKIKKMKKKKIRKIFSLYNLAIVACILMIFASLVIIFEPDFSSIGNIIPKIEFKAPEKDPEASETDKKADDVAIIKGSGKNISEKEAKKTAKKQFKKLGEKVDEKDIEALMIERDGAYYYYCTSAENTLEVSVETGEITRLNSVKVK